MRDHLKAVREPEGRDPRQPLLEGDDDLQVGEVHPRADVRAAAERRVRDFLAPEVEIHRAGVFAFVEAVEGGRDEDHFAGLHFDSVTHDVFGDEPGLVDDREAPQQLLDMPGDALRIGAKLGDIIRMSRQIFHRQRQEIDHRVESGEQHQRDHRLLLIIGRRRAIDLAVDDRADPVVAGIGRALDDGRGDIVEESGVRCRHRRSFFLGCGPVGTEHAGRESGQGRRIGKGQPGKGEEHLDREDVGIGGAEFDSAEVGELVDQLDRDAADGAFAVADLARAEALVEDSAIGGVLGRIHVHGDELVLHPRRLWHDHHPRREMLGLVEELADHAAARRDPVTAVMRSPDEVGDARCLQALPRGVIAVLDSGGMIDIEIDHAGSRDMCGSIGFHIVSLARPDAVTHQNFA